MHYYYHNIKDFRAGCHNLESRLERWIYRDMMDAYYDREGPFPDDLKAICGMLGLRREDEREIVSGLLLLKFNWTFALGVSGSAAISVGCLVVLARVVF